MRQTIYCPFCGEKIVLDEERVDPTRNTTRLDGSELDQLLSHTYRSDIPPPPSSKRGKETMADLGWLRKHIKDQEKREQRRLRALLLLAIVLFALVVSVKFIRC